MSTMARRVQGQGAVTLEGAAMPVGELLRSPASGVPSRCSTGAAWMRAAAGSIRTRTGSPSASGRYSSSNGWPDAAS